MATKWQNDEALGIPKSLIVFGILALLVLGFCTLIYILKLAGDKAQATACVVRMEQIVISGQLWSREHNGLLPTNFISMSNELVTPKLLHCRMDRVRQSANSFEEFSEQQNNSYTMVSPGARYGATNVVFIRCSVHGHLGFADRSVRREDGKRSGRR